MRGMFMITITEVTSRKMLKKFVDFPNRLYKGNPYYIPYLFVDEMGLLDATKNNQAKKANLKCYLAWKDGKIAGRVAVMKIDEYNEICNQKRVRFTRCDFINDIEVTKALMQTVEDYARQNGMDVVHGPMGFNDMDREGMLTDGYEELGTFETNYNYPYYIEHFRALGYEKEARWLEFKIIPPKQANERIARIADMVLKRKNLRLEKSKDKNFIINRYGKEIFKLLDEAYSPLYGFYPYPDEVVENTIQQFKLVLNLDYISIVLNEADEVVGFGAAFPSLAKAVNKSRGRLFPFGLFRMMHAIKHPKIIDLVLIAVKPELKNSGINAVIMQPIMESAIRDGIVFAESNPELETNLAILSQWKNFDCYNHKKRECVVKKLV